MNFRGHRGRLMGSENLSLDIDYKNLDLLRNFVSDTGKITPSHFSGLSRKQQRLVAKAIKQARFLALLPYFDNHR